PASGRTLSRLRSCCNPSRSQSVWAEPSERPAPGMLQFQKSLLVGLLMLGAIAGLGQTPTQRSNQADQRGNSTVSRLPVADPLEGNFPRFLEPGADPENKLFLPFMRHMAEDQKQFWTSPRELK